MTSLKHVGIQVNPTDVVDFYEDILGGKHNGNHQINAELSALIFQIDKEVKIAYVQVDNIIFELFLLDQKGSCTYQHVCIQTHRSKEMYDKAIEKGYEGFSYGNEIAKTYFIKDKAKNIFELKLQ